MLSSLIVSPDETQAILYVKQHFKNVDPFDIVFIDSEKAIGIEEIRNIQKKIFLKPFKSSEKVVVIQKADSASVQAQNALLKILEEPPMHTSIILLAKSKEAFLPTIISRCNIINLYQNGETMQSDERMQTLVTFKEIQNIPIGQKIFLAQKIAENKEETELFLKNTIIAAREEMMQKVEENKSAQNTLQQLSLLQEAYTTITRTNTNPRMILEQLFLQLS